MKLSKCQISVILGNGENKSLGNWIDQGTRQKGWVLVYSFSYFYSASHVPRPHSLSSLKTITLYFCSCICWCTENLPRVVFFLKEKKFRLFFICHFLIISIAVIASASSPRLVPHGWFFFSFPQKNWFSLSLIARVFLLYWRISEKNFQYWDFLSLILGQRWDYASEPSCE